MKKEILKQKLEELGFIKVENSQDGRQWCNDDLSLFVYTNNSCTKIESVQVSYCIFYPNAFGNYLETTFKQMVTIQKIWEIRKNDYKRMYEW